MLPLVSKRFFTPKTIQTWIYPMIPNFPNLPTPLETFPTKDIQAPFPVDLITLNTDVFGQKQRKDILHQVVTWQLASRRAGTGKTKRVSEIAGSGKKPHRQKGTGRARQGQRRRPGSRGGSKAHGPVPRDFSYALPQQIRRLGLKIALSTKFSQNDVLVVDSGSFPFSKTKDAIQWLKWHGLENNTVLYIGKGTLKESAVSPDSIDPTLAASFANIKKFNVIPQCGANVYDILKHEKVVLTLEAIEQLTQRLTQPRQRHIPRVGRMYYETTGFPIEKSSPV